MISAIILAKNEERNIEECLKSISWCDEVIVIDDNSSDRTREITKKHDVRVVTRSLEDFSSQRNFALGYAKGEWVLFVDADERVGQELKNEILTAVKNNSGNNGYFIKRIDSVWGRRLLFGETGNMKLLRLAKKEKGEWDGKVHETWKIEGPIGTLDEPLIHYPHQNISNFLNEVNNYSDIRANELKEEGVRVSFFGIILYPKAKFLQNYFLKLGFLDGIPGVISAAMMSFHSFLVRGKLWLLWQKNSE